MQHEISARLLALLPPGTPMPAHGGWAAAADLLLYLIDIIRQHRSARIVELGSGTSTCWLAWALDVFDIPGTVVSLEHLPEFHRRTLDQLHTCGLRHRAEVRLAPLTDVSLAGTTYPWYDPAGWSDLRDVDLLLVDGPPGGTASMARYPAVPLLGPALRRGAMVVLDDYRRPDEQEIIALAPAPPGLAIAGTGPREGHGGADRCGRLTLSGHGACWTVPS